MTKYLNILISILLIFEGIKIMNDKRISQGNSATQIEDLYLGNYAFPVGGIFLFLGILLISSIYKNTED